MLELDYITVKGFKSIAAIEELRIGAMNVLIGPNGSGKSNFVGVFSFLNAIRSGKLQDYVVRAGGADKVLHFGARETDKLYIDISFQDSTNRYEITLQPAGADDLVPGSEFAHFWNKERYPGGSLGILIEPHGKEAGISRSAPPGVTSYVSKRLNRWKLYHFHDTSDASPMKKTADVNDNRHLRPDGSNLAAFLYLLSKEYPDSYSLITRTVRQVAPFFEGFQLEPQLLNPNKILLAWRHTGTDAYFDASSLSDGTLRFIALATLFPPTGEPAPVGDAGGRTRAGHAPVRDHPAGVADEAGVGRDTGDRVHAIVAVFGPLRAGGRAGRRPCRPRYPAYPAESRRSGAVAGGVQPGPVMGKERIGRTPEDGVTRVVTLDRTRGRPDGGELR